MSKSSNIFFGELIYYASSIEANKIGLKLVLGPVGLVGVMMTITVMYLVLKAKLNKDR